MNTLPHDGWAFLPEDKRPDRLIRFVQDKSSSNVLAVYDSTNNILHVNKVQFDALDSMDQGRVLSTHEDLDAEWRGDRVSIR